MMAEDSSILAQRRPGHQEFSKEGSTGLFLVRVERIRRRRLPGLLDSRRRPRREVLGEDGRLPEHL
jgi:hypothetical protein